MVLFKPKHKKHTCFLGFIDPFPTKTSLIVITCGATIVIQCKVMIVNQYQIHYIDIIYTKILYYCKYVQFIDHPSDFNT